jgi:hypothetical protein
LHGDSIAHPIDKPVRKSTGGKSHPRPGLQELAQWKAFLMRQIITLFCVFLLVAASVAGCAQVSPAQRGVLARPEMQFDPDMSHVKVVDQVYAAREAASGGRVTGGGGCGCTM